MALRLLLASALVLPLLLSPCPSARELASSTEAPASAPQAAPTAQRVDFDSQVEPILQSHCMPCHFPGGKMYDRLPFDRAQTIRDLGEKMFTRIKDEHEQAVLRSFLAQAP